MPNLYSCLVATFLIIIAIPLYYAYYAHYAREKTSISLFELLKESMDIMENPPKVALFGDSVLNNSRYVPLGKSVGARLRNIYGSHLKMYAQDGASINNIYNQLDQYSDKGDAHIVISVGGNNLLNAMHVHALNDKSIDHFAQQYKQLINHVCKTFPSAHIHLLNVYFPLDEPYVKIKKYIEKWNEKVYEMEDVYEQVSIVHIDTLCVKESDFENEVEPSEYGGRKIASAIVQSINNA